MNHHDLDCIGEGSAFKLTQAASPKPTHPRPIKLSPITVPKGWGHELHVCNNDEFCGKELHINAGHRFSMHMHVSKREVFRLRSGLVELTTINMEDASRTTITMKPDDVIEIPRLLPHSIRAIEDSIIDEYSTMDRAEDSLRVEPGSSQTKSTFAEAARFSWAVNKTTGRSYMYWDNQGENVWPWPEDIGRRVRLVKDGYGTIGGIFKAGRTGILERMGPISAAWVAFIKPDDGGQTFSADQDAFEFIS